MTDPQGVAAHYAADGLLARIAAGLDALGRTPPLDLDTLGPVDEFHIGGRLATEALLDRLDIRPETRVLDLGCGLGGPARFVAQRTGARVTGIDLTPDYVDTGQRLNDWTNLADRVTLCQGSVLNLPFEEDSFDLAYMLHVGMNVTDKATLAHEAARVLRPGGMFVVYDVMQVGDGELRYPVPWAATAQLSALAPPRAYREALTGAGFRIVSETDRSGFARDFFARLTAQQATAKGPPPLGLHLLMGPDTATKVGNMIRNIKFGLIAPVEIIARLPG